MSTVTKDNQNDDNNSTDQTLCDTVDENAKDEDALHGSSLKKKIGKFRCLSDDQSPPNENLDQNQELTSQIKSPFVPTLLSNHTENSTEVQPSDFETPKKGKTTKKKTTKSKKDDLEDILMSNRRRSSRLKTLEEKKEASNGDQINNVSEANANNETKTNDEPVTVKVATITSKDNVESTVENEIESTTKKKDKKKKDKKSSKKHDKHDKHDKRRTKRNSSANKLNQNSDESNNSDNEDSKRPNSDECFTSPSSFQNLNNSNRKPEKVKSRWRRNSELESNHIETKAKDALSSSENLIRNNQSLNSTFSNSTTLSSNDNINQQQPNENTEPMPSFSTIDSNIYLIPKRKTKFTKEIKKMVCDCVLTREERSRGLTGCHEDCLNRMLMIECGLRCSLDNHCANQRFCNKQYSKVEAFKTARKGWGLRAAETLQPGQFIMEYVGEVIGPDDFRSRVKKYSKEGREHHFFMALKADEIIDATSKGNITRFVNHSCDPNAETQKWTVGGDLRIGFFSTKLIQPGEEITFDYQFQRYGKEAQRCYCEAENCRGFIGATDVSNEVDIELEDESKSLAKSKTDKLAVNKLKEQFEDLGLEEEIEKMISLGGLKNRQQTLMLARLMVRAEDQSSRSKICEVIMNTEEQACRQLLLDYHCLRLLWSWMVDLKDVHLRYEILKVLDFLTIPNQTMIKDSKVWEVVQRWASDVDKMDASEELAGYKSDISDEKIDNKSDQKTDDKSVDNVLVDSQPKLTNGDVTAEIEKPIKPQQDKEKEKDAQVSNDKATENTSTLSNSELKSSLHKGLNGIKGLNIVKKDSKSIQDQQQQPQKSIPNVPRYAARLLYQWKDLKEVYRIPRLERQKRLEDEKEADRMAMAYETINNTRVTTNAASFLRKNLKRPYDQIGKPGKQQNIVYTQYSQNPQSIPQIVINQTASSTEYNMANKISKEEHRANYNVELMRKDYEEAMKRYKKQFEQYNVAIQQQLNSLNGGIGLHAIQPIQPPMPPAPPSIYPHHQLCQSTTTSPLSTYNHQQFNSNIQIINDKQIQANNKFKNTTLVYQANVPILDPQQQNYPQYLPENDYSLIHQPNYPSIPPKPLQPPSQPQLQPSEYDRQQLVTYNHLANYQQQQKSDELMEVQENESQQELDKSWNTIYAELTGGLNGKSRRTNYIECTGDQHKLNEDKTLKPDYLVEMKAEEDLFNDLFINPGTYFISEGKTYFIPCFSNGTNENLVIECKSELPSKELSEKKLPKDWSKSRDRNGFYYYFNRETNQVQWNVPSDEKTTDHQTNKENMVISSSKTLQIDPKNIDFSSIDQATLTEIMKQFNGNDANNPSNNDLDPRKRVKQTSMESDLQETNALSNNLSLELENKIIKFPYQQPQQQQQQQQPIRHLSEKRIKEKFKSNLSDHIKNCLNPYRRSECKSGRILCIDDFKYLCRKMTHMIMLKELKHCRSTENLVVSDAVKHKSKEFVRKYMGKKEYSPFYKRDDEKLDDDDEGADERTIVSNSPLNKIYSPGFYQQNHSSQPTNLTTNSANSTPTQDQVFNNTMAFYEGKKTEENKEDQAGENSATENSENKVLTEQSIDISEAQESL